MKRCPQCQSTYIDDTIRFCRHDGAVLTNELSLESSTTRNLPSSFPSAESSTQVLQHKPSIAVLPFSNMSSDPDNEYFCDGLAEELLNSLTKIEALHVAARTSAFSFKGKETDVSEIGRRLNVETVLEGGVRKAGNRLRITAQLVDVRDGYHLWSDRYDLEMKDIFDIQDEISLAIVEALKLKLLGAEKATILKRYTENTEAYQLYLKGRYHNSKWNKEGWEKAVEYYEQALAKEPDYAPAWAAIANTKGQLWYFGHTVPDASIQEMKLAVARALDLDPTLSDAHMSKARVLLWYDWDWTASEQEFRQALKLNPNNTEARALFCFLLALQGRHSEAIAEVSRALELDPLSLSVNYCHALIFWLTGDYDRLLQHAHKVIELEPNYFGGYWMTGAERWVRGAYEEAIPQFQKAVALNAGPLPLAYVGCLYGIVGDREQAQRVLDELQTLSTKQYVHRYCFAIVWAGLGELDRTFELLEQSYERREGVLLFLKHVARQIPQLGTDPRLADLLKRIGLL
jgi:serine/threonine-protein kinase